MILLDASGLYSALNSRQPEHDATRRAVEAEPPPRILSPFVLAEVDYLVSTRDGAGAELALLDEVGRGAYELVPFLSDDVSGARTVVELYRDLGIGLADASIVVLASRFGTNRVLTHDERHFRALRTPDGRPFTLLPADA